MKKIAQPYCVWWDHEGRSGPVDRWCRDNLSHYYNFLAVGNDARMLEIGPSFSAIEAEHISRTTLLCMFECPRDAMLFKLTWCGHNGSEENNS
jgi:hypothetical protein